MESISAQVMDLHTDVADLEAKESFLDRMIASCRSELKNLTEDADVAKYPLKHVPFPLWLYLINLGLKGLLFFLTEAGPCKVLEN